MRSFLIISMVMIILLHIQGEPSPNLELLIIHALFHFWFSGKMPTADKKSRSDVESKLTLAFVGVRHEYSRKYARASDNHKSNINRHSF